MTENVGQDSKPQPDKDCQRCFGRGHYRVWDYGVVNSGSGTYDWDDMTCDCVLRRPALDRLEKGRQ